MKRKFICLLSFLLMACTEKPIEQSLSNIFDPLADFDDIPPIVEISVTPDSGIANETVFEFDAGKSRENDKEGTNLLYLWDMDDNGIWDSTETINPLIKKKFEFGGDKKINLRVRGAKNLFSDTSFTVHVSTRPAIVLDWVRESSYFRFNASSSSDAEDGKNLEFRWDFNSDQTWDIGWDSSSVAENNFDDEEWLLTIEARDLDKTVAVKNYDLNLAVNTLAVFTFSGDANDVSGNKNHGAVYGATLSEDRFGNPNSAYQFDGIDDYIEIENNPIFGTNEKSIHFWFYKSSGQIENTLGPNDVEGLIFKSFDTVSPRDFSFSISNLQPPFGISFQVLNNGSTFNTRGVNYIQPYTWYNVVGTITENELTLFVNGEFVDKIALTGHFENSNAPIVLGKASSSSLPTRYFDGIIDEIYFYNRVLSLSEIQNLYNK